jgi:pimeloyl-ACP methyl ester carboxylesterase
VATSPNWPGVAPGARGINNAISGKHVNLAGFAQVEPKAAVLWIRGADDQVVSDTSLFDLGYLGSLGAVPGWPGDVFPPQPMIAQTRAVLDAYQAGGGKVREEVLPDCGHSPHIELAETFNALLAEAVTA